MHFKILDSYEKESQKNDIVKILTDSDRDFVPPLSSRNSTLDKSFLSESSSGDGINSYYDAMKDQEIIAAIEGDAIVGIVSYRLDFLSDEITEADIPNIYVSTLVLDKGVRGKGITKRMYSYLFGELYADRNIFTRTWSTNFAHIKILGDFGFSEIIRKIDDRGKGIDTVYYKRPPAKILKL